MAHIFDTVTRETRTPVTVATETGNRGGTIITVRDGGGMVLLAVPTTHASVAILASVLDDTDAQWVARNYTNGE